MIFCRFTSLTSTWVNSFLELSEAPVWLPHRGGWESEHHQGNGQCKNLSCEGRATVKTCWPSSITWRFLGGSIDFRNDCNEKLAWPQGATTGHGRNHWALWPSLWAAGHENCQEALGTPAGPPKAQSVTEYVACSPSLNSTWKAPQFQHFLNQSHSPPPKLPQTGCILVFPTLTNDKPRASSLIFSISPAQTTGMSRYSYVLDNSKPCPLIYTFTTLPAPTKMSIGFFWTKAFFLPNWFSCYPQLWTIAKD